MQPNKTYFVKEITDRQVIKDIFLVKTVSRAETKTGKPYLMLTIMDKSGEMACRVWEKADQLLIECPPGAIISLNGQAQTYKGVLQLKVDKIVKLDSSTIDISQFMPTTSGDIEEMAKEIIQIATSITNPWLRKLMFAFFKNNKFMVEFKKSTAAKMMHHAYIGGLLEHTLSVVRLAQKVCTLYPTIDHDLLVSGALLHDIGKIREFDSNLIPPDYSDQGRLVGHMVLGVEMIHQQVTAIKNFPDELAATLKHLILSHHGQHQFGAPALPMMLEAFVLHFLDDLDAKINYFDSLAGQTTQEGYHWSEYQRHMERFMFVKGTQQDDNIVQLTRQKQNSNPISRQHKLF